MTWTATGRHVRRVLIALFTVGPLLWLSMVGLPVVCSQQVPSGTTVSVEICEAASVADPRFLLLVLAIGLLLLPELAEIEVAGVLKVRKQVKEAKEEVSGLSTELGHIRAQILTTAVAAANSNSRASVENYNLFPERFTDVSRALKEVAGDGGDFDAGEERGVYAAIAFEAGFYGLTRYLPDRMMPAVVAGYVFDDNEKLALYSVATHGDGIGESEAAQRMAAAPRMTGVFLYEREDEYVVTAPACDDEGLVVGALAVRMPTSAAALDQGDGGDTVGTVELMANAFARLLIDVMGDRPRKPPAGKAGSEGTQ